MKVIKIMSKFTPGQVRKLTHLSARYGFSYDEVEDAMHTLMGVENSFDAAYGRLQSIAGDAMQLQVSLKYRDVRYILPYFIQILMFVTPVIYPPSIAGKYSWILAINPMTAVIKGARGALLGTEPINWFLLSISLTAVAIIFIIGFYMFKKTERYFADIV
jgi:hypothetical protein